MDMALVILCDKKTGVEQGLALLHVDPPWCDTSTRKGQRLANCAFSDYTHALPFCRMGLVAAAVCACLRTGLT